MTTLSLRDSEYSSYAQRVESKLGDRGCNKCDKEKNAFIDNNNLVIDSSNC